MYRQPKKKWIIPKVLGTSQRPPLPPSHPEFNGERIAGLELEIEAYKARKAAAKACRAALDREFNDPGNVAKRKAYLEASLAKENAAERPGRRSNPRHTSRC
jgi:hypothetical protein